MPQLNPISAIRFADHGSDISTFIAPPYDVLDEGPKQDLLSLNAQNIVGVDLPVTPPKTVGPDEAYDSAGDQFRQWLDQGVMSRDESPAVYAYEQVYKVGDQQFKRRGLFATLTTEEFGRHGGGIHRHELTIKAGTDDRLKLMEATSAQLSPIFGIFSDPDGKVAHSLAEHFDGREPDFHGTTANDSVEHRCWRVADAGTIDELQSFFDSADVFIADGHHRYTTALNYGKANPANDAAGHCLFVLVAREDPGMIVLPTHRILCGLEGFSIDKLIAATEGNDLVTVTKTNHGESGLAELEAGLPEAGHHAMALFDPATGETALITTSGSDPLGDSHSDKPNVWRELDVAILQHLWVKAILEPAFGGGNEINYKYTAHLDEVPDMTRVEPGRLGVIVQYTPLKSVCDVSLAGEVMPPKSTYFFPKLATGLVVNPLD